MAVIVVLTTDKVVRIEADRWTYLGSMSTVPEIGFYVGPPYPEGEGIDPQRASLNGYKVASIPRELIEVCCHEENFRGIEDLDGVEYRIEGPSPDELAEIIFRAVEEAPRPSDPTAPEPLA